MWHLPVKRCLNEVQISLSGKAIGLLASLEGVLPDCLKINFPLLVSYSNDPFKIVNKTKLAGNGQNYTEYFLRSGKLARMVGILNSRY